MIRRPPISTLFPYPTLFRSFDYGQQPHRVDVSSGGAVFSSNGAQLTLSLVREADDEDRKSTRLNSSHANISYAVFCLKKKNHLANSLGDYDILQELSNNGLV